MGTFPVKANYYQQFDADYNLDVPGEGMGGWRSAEINLSTEHTAVVVMHAWDMGTRERYPGWHRCVEYIPRAEAICRDVFPGLLAAVRRSPLPLIHVVDGRGYYRSLDGWKKTVELAGRSPVTKYVRSDPALDELRRFKRDHVFVGGRNHADVERGQRETGFAPQAVPLDGEPVAANTHQLFALCRDHTATPVIYTGFAINACLYQSPGGMVDMSRRGIMCSCIRQAVTAVENRETARQELCKQVALWWVSLVFGFVFDVDDFTAALAGLNRTNA